MPFLFDNHHSARTFSKPGGIRSAANRIIERTSSRLRRKPAERTFREGEPKSKLLVVITDGHLGGAQSNVYDLVSSFREHYDIHLVVGVSGRLSERVLALGLPVTTLASLNRSIDPVSDFRSIVEFRRIVRQVRPHLIHAHSTKAGMVARVVGLLERVPVVYTAHGWVFSPGFPLRMRSAVWFIELLAARISSHVICVSEYDRRLAKRYLRLPEERLSVVPCGIRRTTATSRIPGSYVRLIMVARFQEPKDHATAIRAVAQLKPDSYRMTFVGSGPLVNDAIALAAELQVSDQIDFVGDSSKVSQLLAEADIFLLFSRHEGLPISILEAMRASLPVIASRVGGVAEEVEDGVSGLLVQSGDVTRAAKAITYLVENPRLRAELGDAGRKIFERRFTRANMIEQLADIYATNRLA